MDKAKEYDKKVQLKVYNYLKNHPCIDCGEQDIVVLEFDHLRDKDLSISQMMAKGRSWVSILIEIEKCEVVCANCHKRRTAKRGNWLKMGVSANGKAI